MKRFRTIVTLLLILSLSSCKAPVDGGVSADMHKPGDTVGEWETALQYLEDGNQRYLNANKTANDSNAADRAALKDGQNPFAVVVTCSDSRVPPEIIFDQNLGDIFVIRNAGNISDETTLGSIEYAVEHLHVPLVVVMGHSSCGAVTAAFEGGEFPENLQTIVDTIAPLTENAADIDDAISRNISGSVECVEENEIVHEMGAKVIGAIYNIESGEIIWLP